MNCGLNEKLGFRFSTRKAQTNDVLSALLAQESIMINNSTQRMTDQQILDYEPNNAPASNCRPKQPTELHHLLSGTNQRNSPGLPNYNPLAQTNGSWKQFQSPYSYGCNPNSSSKTHNAEVQSVQNHDYLSEHFKTIQ